jgi:ATP-binding cassette subfamily B protein
VLTALTDNPLIYLVRCAWTYATGYRGRFILYIVLSVAGLGINLCEPYVIGRILNAVQEAATGNAGGLKQTIFHYLAIYFGIHVGFWILHGPSRVIERDVAVRIRSAFQMRLFNVVMALPIGWHREHHSGITIDRINRAITGLFDFCDRSFEIIHLCTRFCGSLIALTLFMPPVAGMVLIASAIVAVVVLLFDKFLLDYYQILNRKFNHTASAIHDYVTNIITVLCLRLENNVAAEVLDRVRQTWSIFRKNAIVNEVKWFITTMMVIGTIAGICAWYVGGTISRGEVLLAGSFFTLFEYLRRIGDSFYGFALKYGQLVQFAANVRGAAPIMESFDETLEQAAHASLPQNWREVRIENLDYTYEDDKHRLHHLKDVSLFLRRGHSIALVGQSGSGKSTLLSIVRGLRTSVSVEVLCDGNSLPLGIAHVAHHATLIPQDPEIFADSVRFNISMGIEADDATIHEAIRLARFENVLPRLPTGLDTNIAEKGVNLSGGEKQRLALARGIFFARQSDIILLDEPTSSVDFHNEQIIYDNLMKTFSDRCIISSIHRLHLLAMFDEILVLEDGVITERGTLTSLIAAGGPFARSWAGHRDKMPQESAKS